MLNMNFKDEANRTAAFKYLNDKMEEAFQQLVAADYPEKAKNTRHLFNTETHVHILHNTLGIFLPAEKTEWPKKLKNVHYEDEIPWPHATTYFYTMDVIAPPFMPASMLNFGYAFLDNKLIATAFYVAQRFVDYQSWTQGIAIDPIAVEEGIKPSFYIGCPVEKEFIENFLITRKKSP